MIGKTNNTSPEEEVLSNLKKSTDETLQKLTALSMEEKKSKNEDIKAMIYYIGGMTDTIEERRNRLIEFAWQSLTIAITAFGLIYAVKFILLLKVPVMVVLFLLFGFSVAKLIEFRAQSSFSYPFLKYKEYGNKWKWFYYGNEYILHITESPFQSKPRAKDEQSYVQGLKFSRQ